jgi:hypothetical protein
MDHAEGKIFERLQRIMEEVKVQEEDKLELFGKQTKKKAKLTIDTTLSLDVFEYFLDQF